MEASSSNVDKGPPEGAQTLQLRMQVLQVRVNDAARALYEQGLRPTVARVRAALGGGSPNDLTPALKHWREVVLPGLPLAASSRRPGPPPLPLQLADLVYEVWQWALAAARVEVRGGATAREVTARTAEAQALRQQLADLRDRLQRESLAYGELRALAARHEAIARDALARVHQGEVRERDLLRELGALRQRMAVLEVTAGKHAVVRSSEASKGRGASRSKAARRPPLPRGERKGGGRSASLRPRQKARRQGRKGAAR
jgi:hypothetical protein